MALLQGSFVAVDFDECGAVVKSNNGFAASTGPTPQDAINAALANCQVSMTGCHTLTYSCATSSDGDVPHSCRIKVAGGSHRRGSSSFSEQKIDRSKLKIRQEGR